MDSLEEVFKVAERNLYAIVLDSAYSVGDGHGSLFRAFERALIGGELVEGKWHGCCYPKTEEEISLELKSSVVLAHDIKRQLIGHGLDHRSLGVISDQAVGWHYTEPETMVLQWRSLLARALTQLWLAKNPGYRAVEGYYGYLPLPVYKTEEPVLDEYEED